MMSNTTQRDNFFKVDRQFKNEVIEKVGANVFQACLFCGMCTAGCAYTGLRPDLDPRKFIRQIALGMRAGFKFRFYLALHHLRTVYRQLPDEC